MRSHISYGAFVVIAAVGGCAPKSRLLTVDGLISSTAAYSRGSQSVGLECPTGDGWESLEISQQVVNLVAERTDFRFASFCFSTESQAGSWARTQATYRWGRRRGKTGAIGLVSSAGSGPHSGLWRLGIPRRAATDARLDKGPIDHEDWSSIRGVGLWLGSHQQPLEDSPQHCFDISSTSQIRTSLSGQELMVVGGCGPAPRLPPMSSLLVSQGLWGHNPLGHVSKVWSVIEESRQPGG